MMKTTTTSLAALVAFAGMEANAIAIRDDALLEEYLQPEAGLFAQTEQSNFKEIRGMCTDSQGRQYDYFETNGIRHGWGRGGKISVDQCQKDCAATPKCVGVQFSRSAGRCGLRVDDGAVVTLPEYETPWNVAAGVGPVASAIPAGDWTCGVNPNYGGNWKELKGMCTDSKGKQYDYFEKDAVSAGWGGGGKMDLEDCKRDCLATKDCVGVQHSASSGRCGLRVNDCTKVSFPGYETYSNCRDGYTGVGPVAGAAPQGDWMCLVNSGDDLDCDDNVNFMYPGPAYSQISLTDSCGSGNCAGHPVYGAPNDNEKAKAYCAKECTDRQGRGQACEGFFFQQHHNGHEICGFYASGMDSGNEIKHGHKAGAICRV